MTEQLNPGSSGTPSEDSGSGAAKPAAAKKASTPRKTAAKKAAAPRKTTAAKKTTTARKATPAKKAPAKRTTAATTAAAGTTAAEATAVKATEAAEATATAATAADAVETAQGAQSAPAAAAEVPATAGDDAAEATAAKATDAAEATATAAAAADAVETVRESPAAAAEPEDAKPAEPAQTEPEDAKDTKAATLTKEPAAGDAGGSGGTPRIAKEDGDAAEPIRAIPVRHYGRYVSGALVLAFLVWLISAFAGGNVNWNTVGDYITDGNILAGMGRTLMISVVSMIIGLVLGVVLAVMRMSKNPVTGGVSWLFIWIFRGTPVYVQLLLWYSLALIFPVFEIPFIYKDEMTDVMTPLVVALLGLGLNEGAYMAEIVRAGIQSVDEGQTEAAHALGMTQAQTMRRVVLPQAMRVIIPPTGNEFINLLKTSSLVAVVSYPDLLRSAQIISGRTYAVMEMLFVASFWYLALTSVFSVGQYYLERRYARGSLRDLPKTPWQKVKANLSTLRRPEVAR